MRKIIFYISSIVLISLFSCEKIIDINIPDKDKKIVINSIISTDSLVKINVSKSMNILDEKDAIFLNQATVKLYENGNFIEQLPFVSDGDYKSNSFYPSQGKTYSIEVKSEGLQTVTASNTIPEKIKINSIDTLTVNNENTFGVECSINFTDPSDEKNYYYLFAKALMPNDYNMNGIPTSWSKNNIYLYTDDNIVETSLSNSSGLVFSDNLINGQSYTLKVNIDSWNFYADTNKVYFYLSSISKDFYLYLKSYEKNNLNKNDPFAEPVQVYENINNGYGIFAGYSSYVDSVNITIKYPEY